MNLTSTLVFKPLNHKMFPAINQQQQKKGSGFVLFPFKEK